MKEVIKKYITDLEDAIGMKEIDIDRLRNDLRINLVNEDYEEWNYNTQLVYTRFEEIKELKVRIDTLKDVLNYEKE